MTPTAPPALELAEPVGFFVTVLPDAVVVGAGADFGVTVGAAGLAFAGGLLVRIGGGVGAGVVRPTGVAGTSFSAGCAVVSRPANARSLLSAVSVASAVSDFFSDTVHAANASTVNSASGAPSLRIYLVMSCLQNMCCGLRGRMRRTCGAATTWRSRRTTVDGKKPASRIGLAAPRPLLPALP